MFIWLQYGTEKAITAESLCPNIRLKQKDRERKMKIQIKWNIWSKFITRKITENEHETSLTDKFEPNNEKTTKRASGSSGKGFIAL